MAGTARVMQGSMSAGELSPELHFRVDLAKYLVGLATCYNTVIRPQGGARNRPGTRYVAAVKNAADTIKLVPFIFSVTDTYMLEFGSGYMRVIRNVSGVAGNVTLPSAPAAYNAGTTYATTDHVSYGGVNYYSRVDGNLGNQPDISPTQWYALTDDIVEIPSPYTDTELSELQFTQSNDVITFVHPSYPPKELARTDHHLWSFSDITFEPATAAPTGVVISSSGTGTHDFVVTAINDETGEESLPSSSVTGGDTSQVSWSAVTGAGRYVIYKKEDQNGMFGYIGTTEDLSFTDSTITADQSDTPPSARNPFNATDDYPSTVEYHEQRLAFANTNNEPQAIWFSKTGAFHNFTVSTPSKDDDAITVRLNSRQQNEIRSLVSIEDLITLSAGAEWKVTSGDAAFAFQNLRRKKQGTRGSGLVQPLVIGSTILHQQARGNVIRELGYRLESDSYAGDDVTVLARHLFDDLSMVAWDVVQAPDTVIWVVRSDGVLLGLTYHREHDVAAWHRHETTSGLFKDVAVVPEGDSDAAYFVVERTINSSTVKYIERLEDRRSDPLNRCFFVDCGLSNVLNDGTFTPGAPSDTVSGLDHLEGEEVAILTDGVTHPRRTVTSGSVTLDYAATAVTIGLPYTSRIKTLEPAIQAGIGKYKSAARVTIKMLESIGFWLGPNEDRMVEAKQFRDPNWVITETYTGDIEVVIDPSWTDNGVVVCEQRDPLPMHIMGFIPDEALGG